MKILLINPPPRSPGQANVLVPPLGLAYLAAMLEKNHLPVEILDANVLRLTWEKFRQMVAQKRPDLIGLTGMTPTIDTTFKAAQICRPYCRWLVLGGPHATIFGPQVFKQAPEFDFLVKGEGEMAFLGLVNDLMAGKRPPRVIVGPLVNNLDRLPFPSRHLLPQNLYRYPLVDKLPFTTMISSRGCPYGCLFCDKSVFGQTYRARSPQNVVDEIETLVCQDKIRSLVFFDDLFTLNRQRVAQICREILHRHLKLTWKAEARVNTVDAQTLALMKKAGCSLLAYGVESANQKSLDFLQKGEMVAQAKKAFRLTRQAGIKTLGYFILGIPGETYAEAQKTIQLALDLQCDYAQFSILTPYPGTKLSHLASRRGWLAETAAQNPFDQDIRKPALLSPGWTPAKLKKIIREAHRRFYFRPKYLGQQLLALGHPDQIRFALESGWRLMKWYRN